MQVAGLFPDDAKAEEWFIQQRWPKGVSCPKCGSAKVSERTTAQRQWRCNACRKDFSTRTDTLMQGSNLGFRTWALAIYLLTTSLKGIASTKLASDLQITQKSAWHLAMRIRETYRDNVGKLGGEVEVDETFIGGKQKNRSRRTRALAKDNMGAMGKQVVIGMKQRGGQIKAKPVINTGARTLQAEVRSAVKEDATLYTEELRAYLGLGADYDHHSADHSAWEHVKGEAHTNGIESFWAMLKRGYMGTHHYMGHKHLERYVNEFAGRFNGRKAHTIDRMARISPPSHWAQVALQGFDGR